MVESAAVGNGIVLCKLCVPPVFNTMASANNLKPGEKISASRVCQSNSIQNI